MRRPLRYYYLYYLLAFIIVVLRWKTVSGQNCIWEPSKASTKCGILGKSVEFYFKSLTNLQDGNLFRWKIDGKIKTESAYSSASKKFVPEGSLADDNFNSSSVYINNEKSEHTFTIKSLTISDDGKKVSFHREGCSSATEEAEPFTLAVSCCDPSYFGINATTRSCESSIRCNESVVFSCNETMYQPTNFTAKCQANFKWNLVQDLCVPYCDPSVFESNASTTNTNIKQKDKVIFTCNDKIYQTKNFTAECETPATWSLSQHSCVLKSCSKLPNNVIFTDSGVKTIYGGESKSVSCDKCATIASSSTGTCVTDDDMVTINPPITCTPKNCSVLPTNSRFKNEAIYILCGEPEPVVCVSGFMGLSGTNGTCSTNDGIVTLSQNLTCASISNEGSGTLSGGAIAGIILTCLLCIGLVGVGVYFFRKKKKENMSDQNKESGERLKSADIKEADENDQTVEFKT